MFFDYCYARVSAGFVQDQYQKFCLSSPTLSACMRVGGNRGFCCSMFMKSQQNHNQNCFLCKFRWRMICSFWEWKSEVSHEMCGVRSPHLKQNDLYFAQPQLHMLHVLQFAALQGPGFSFSWKQFQITLFHLTTECIHLAIVPAVVITFLPKCLVHIPPPTKLLLTKRLTTNTHCQTEHLALHPRLSCTHTHWNPHWFLPLLSPTQCWQFKTISIQWTTPYILHARMSVVKHTRSTEICSILINIQYIIKT